MQSRQTSRINSCRHIHRTWRSQNSTSIYMVPKLHSQRLLDDLHATPLSDQKIASQVSRWMRLTIMSCPRWGLLHMRNSTKGVGILATVIENIKIIVHEPKSNGSSNKLLCKAQFKPLPATRNTSYVHLHVIQSTVISKAILIFTFKEHKTS